MDNQNAVCSLGKEAICHDRGKCARCGWNYDEHDRRANAIRNGELKRDDDGLKRLHIKKEEQTIDADSDL